MTPGEWVRELVLRAFPKTGTGQPADEATVAEQTVRSEVLALRTILKEVRLRVFREGLAAYTVGGSTFGSLIFGYYYGPNLIYAARTRNGSRASGRSHEDATAAGNARLFVLKSAEGAGRTLGRRADGCEDGELWLAQTSSGRPVRVCEMDTGQPSPPLEVHWPA